MATLPASLIEAIERAFLAIVTDPAHLVELRALRDDRNRGAEMFDQLQARLAPLIERELGPIEDDGEH